MWKVTSGEGLRDELSVAGTAVGSSWGSEGLGTAEGGHVLQCPLAKAVLPVTPSAPRGLLLQPGYCTACRVLPGVK